MKLPRLPEWYNPFFVVLMLVTATLLGAWRDWWWLWLTYWLLSESMSILSGRLIHHQRRHIELLKEGSRLDAELLRLSKMRSEELALLLIEVSNPGIDMDEVKRQRCAAADKDAR